MRNRDAGPRTWMITGCSTGLGRELAQQVIAHGDRLIATARDPAALSGLVDRAPDRVRALALDVNDPDAVKAGAAAGEKAFGGVDVLVNNAGYAYLAAVEEGDMAEVRAQFETNVFGLFEMTQAILPGMRRRGGGHIVNISSVAGLVGNPSAAFYAATKFAVEGFSEALSKEVAPLGIRVTAVAPGAFRTDWAGRSLRQASTRLAAYEATAGQHRSNIAASDGKRPGDPARAAAAIIAVVEAEAPPLHLLLGRRALESVQAKHQALAKDISTWEGVTRSADFPE